MDVPIRERDVEIPRDDEAAARRPHLPRPGAQGLEEAELRGVVLSAVGDVDRRDREVADLGRDDARLVVEGGMPEGRPRLAELLAEVEGDSRVAAGAVPVAPVAFGLEEQLGNLVGLRLDLLEADGVRPFGREPIAHLRLTGADPVDVPGRDFHREEDGSESRSVSSARAASSARPPVGVLRLREQILDPGERELERAPPGQTVRVLARRTRRGPLPGVAVVLLLGSDVLLVLPPAPGHALTLHPSGGKLNAPK